jgi:hypothetical protein
MTYLPDIYKEFHQQFPDIAKAHDELALKCHSWGPLDERTRRLIKLSIAKGLNSEGGVRSHAPSTGGGHNSRRDSARGDSSFYHGWFPDNDCCHEMDR